MTNNPKSHSRINRVVTQFQPHSDYQPLSTIGIGTFGAVFLAKDKQDKKVAIKKVCLDPHFKNRELDLVEKLDHPNCLRYITHYTTNEGKNNDLYLHLVTEYLPGSLSSFLTHSPFPPPIFVKTFGYQLFASLAYLHHFGVCHRDIKPSNVLVNPETGELQLCDFGSAKFLRSDEISVSYIATRSYRAPELLLDCPIYTTAIDVWAAGCVLCEMFLQGKQMFTGMNNNELMNCISRTIGAPKQAEIDSYVHKKKYAYLGPRPGNLRDALPKWVPPEFANLLDTIFVYTPAKRATAADCMKHPFFADLFEADTKLPNGAPLPAYFAKIRTPEEMFRNFPNGPIPPR
ncbi:CMGC family protein kinase [Tritrichomonas foetus]|uniref:CMGC family protein kinase n=1 Tax=Tritrichomonas foetus TaxID=1144522 RepID=A0A1J4JBM3_9EUKA|nr:CMGC family protein kinase [Tritrichomonas foetus]|eukprot:OHS96594.1 CMGC family protein kinase [Tritrichomonas foetus]